MRICRYCGRPVEWSQSACAKCGSRWPSVPDWAIIATVTAIWAVVAISAMTAAAYYLGLEKVKI